MERFKKLYKAVFTVCALCGILLIPGLKAQAVDMTPVTLNEEFTGKLEQGDTVHYYSFTVDKQGYFTISFAPKDITLDPDWGWKVGLYDGDNGKAIAEYTIKNSYTTPKFAFAAGKKLYLQVQASWDFAAPVNQVYAIKIDTVANSAWEKESNDTVASANAVKKNTNYYGNLYHADDADYFKYQVTTDGNQIFTFAPVDMTADPDWGWEIEVYDGSSNEQLLTWETKIKTSFPVMDFKKGTKLLFKIKAKWDLGAPIGQDYSFVVKEKNSSYWEGEDRQTEGSWNSYKRGSKKIVFNKKYNGTLWDAKDQDLYKIVLPKDGLITLTFNPNEVSSSLGWGYKVYLKDASGKDIATQDRVKQKISNQYYLKKGTYYVHLCAEWDLDAPINKMYTLSAAYKSYTPAQVTAVKAKKTVISWKKQKEAEGYEVCYSKNKKFRGSTTVKTTKATTKLTDLKKGTTYYVRVRAYKTTQTKTPVYGAWSSTITIKN